MDAKVRNKICSSESLDNREKMFKSRRIVLLLNIMLVLSFAIFAVGLIYLVLPDRVVYFPSKLGTVLQYLGLSVALRNSVFFRDYHGKIVSLGLLLVTLIKVGEWLVYAVPLSSLSSEFGLRSLMPTLVLVSAVINCILVFGPKFLREV